MIHRREQVLAIVDSYPGIAAGDVFLKFRGNNNKSYYNISQATIYQDLRWLERHDKLQMARNESGNVFHFARSTINMDAYEKSLEASE